MCDVKKFSEIYKEISTLQPEDTLQLVLEAETEEEKDFYELVGDFLLQKKQKQVIEKCIVADDEDVLEISNKLLAQNKEAYEVLAK